MRRIRFDSNGDPLPPELIRDGLAFPDGVSIFPGNLEKTQWRTYAGSPARQFFNPSEAILNPSNVSRLRERWRFTTGAIVTGSPTVAAVFVPGEGVIQVVYFQAWDLNVYAVRLSDGSELWRFTTDDQPGASFPQSGSLDVTRIGNRDRVFVGSGEIVYALDAVTGAELWRFAAGTGCVDAQGNPPGRCAHTDERNQVESSPIVVGGDTLVFGMDVDDSILGKGGFYGVDARTGSLRWYFDVTTGQTCTPDPGDDVRQFDGYHSEAELGLPAGFLASRPGCGFDRAPNGCGNVWSSAAVDEGRGLLYFATSNCDTATSQPSPLPLPPMPPYDEAIVALDFDGFPAWRWRPREIDNLDLAFGAAPNLFSIDARRRSDRGARRRRQGRHLLRARSRRREREQPGRLGRVPARRRQSPRLPVLDAQRRPGRRHRGHHRHGVRRRGAAARVLQHGARHRRAQQPALQPDPPATAPDRARARHGHGRDRLAERRADGFGRELRAHQRHPRRDLRWKRAPEHPARLSDGRRQRDAAALLESVGRRRGRLGLRS